MIKRRLKVRRREGFKNVIISNGLGFFPERCSLITATASTTNLSKRLNVKYKVPSAVPSVSSFM